MILSREEALEALEKKLEELTSTPTGRRAFLQAAPLLFAACASAQKTRYREGDNTGQAAALTVAQERQMTQEVLPEMRKDYPALRDPQMQSYVSSLGRKVATANNLEGKPYNYTFTVVDVPMVNAFALPAGTVFVTTPLIAMAETEAELAGVVGHEIGHIQARHTAERMYMAKKEEGKSAWYAAGGGLLGAALGYGFGRMVCKPKDKECLTKSAALGAAAGVGGGLLIQKYKFMAHSREDEMEADRIGFRTSVKAGYDKNHVGRFYEKLLMMEQQAKGGSSNALLARVTDAMSTHPPSKERVQQMRQLATQTAQQGKVSSEDFSIIRKKASAYSRRHSKKG